MGSCGIVLVYLTPCIGTKTTSLITSGTRPGGASKPDRLDGLAGDLRVMFACRVGRSMTPNRSEGRGVVSNSLLRSLVVISSSVSRSFASKGSRLGFVKDLRS